LAILAVALLYGLVWLIKRFKQDRYQLGLFLTLLISTIFVIFLMNIRSTIIWQAIPLIQAIQFPWRLLMFTTIFTPVLFLLMIARLKGAALYLPLTILTIAAISLNVSYFRPGEINNHDDAYFLHRFLPRAALLPGEKISAAYLLHAEDYVPLPKGALRPTALPSAKLTAHTPTTAFTILDANPFNFRAKVTSLREEQLTFHTFFYPGWTVRVDNYPTAITKNEIGAITFMVPSGQHQVVISYEDTPLRLFSNIISLGSFVFAASYLIYQLVSRHAASAARSSKSSRSGD
ncbi:MAG: hypothetical protein WAV56_04865, partial [Microgenomates group bacterium]